MTDSMPLWSSAHIMMESCAGVVGMRRSWRITTSLVSLLAFSLAQQLQIYSRIKGVISSN